MDAGGDWTLEQLEEAVRRGPHSSALVPEAIKIHQQEVDAKAKKGQVQVIEWEELKKNLPRKLKLSPLAMVPHKSRLF